MVIYRIYNINTNKAYIGQTIQKVQRRWNVHISNLRKRIHYNTYLQRAWDKYGEKYFKFEVIKECQSINDLNFWEEYLIKREKTHKKNHGYNIDFGGKNFKNRIPWNKGKKDCQRAWNKGKKGVSKTTAERMSRAHKGSKPWIAGKHHTDQARLKMSISKGMKPFKVYEKVNKQYVGTWISMAQCGRDLNIKNYRNIGDVLIGKRNTCDGFIFQY